MTIGEVDIRTVATNISGSDRPSGLASNFIVNLGAVQREIFVCVSLWKKSVSTGALGLLLGFRADCRGDVATHLGEGAAVCGSERIKALTLHGLARDGSARARFTAG